VKYASSQEQCERRIDYPKYADVTHWFKLL
jgi:hypothetical protein